MKSRENLFVGLGMVALAVLLVGCGKEETGKAPAPETVRGLNVQVVKLESLPDEIEAPGTVVSAGTAAVSAQVMGTVTSVAVREGDSVRAGQLLVALDERELSARRAAAQAAVAEANAAKEETAKATAAAQAQADVAAKTFERFTFLREQKSVSPQEFDEVAARNSAAQAQLAAAKAKQQQVDAMITRAQAEARAAETVAGYARVVAPFSGVVVRRNVDAGQLASPGVPLIVIEDSSRYRLEVTVDAADAARVQRGTKARVQLDALPGKTFQGAVVEREAGADPGSHTVRAKIELPQDPALRSGLFGRAYFARGETRAIAVAPGTILHRGQLHAVYALDSAGVARLRMVTLGRERQNRVEVLSGLAEGDRVVADPAGRDLEGKRVER